MSNQGENQVKKVFMLSLCLISSGALAITQDEVTPTKYPEAFNISTCVKASYNVDVSVFAKSKFNDAGSFRFAMFEKLGEGKYAPNGKVVIANYNAYVATQGKVKASSFLWEAFNCNALL